MTARTRSSGLLQGSWRNWERGEKKKKNRQNEMVTVALSKKEAERTGYGLSYHWLSEDSLTEGVEKKEKKERKSAGSVPKRQGEMEKHKYLPVNVRFTGR